MSFATTTSLGNGASTFDNGAELLANKRAQLHLKRRKIELIKSFGLAYYQPHPKQNAFHRSTAKRRMMRSGNRFGKSTMGCAEDCAWLLGYRPWLLETDPAYRSAIPQHPVKLLVVTTDWSKVDEVFTSQRGEGEGKLWKFLPKGFVKKVKRNHDGVIDIIECQNGSLIRFDTVRSWVNNPQGTESTDWDAIHVDEPCPEGMWQSASRGLIDRHGSAWFTLTPLREFWINDLFFPEDTGGLARTGVWAETGSTYDNPYLKPEAIKEFESNLTADEIQCRINGIPLHLSGLIYKQFSFAKHVPSEVPKGWVDYATPPLDYSHYFYIDPHPQTPIATLFLAVSPHGQHFYYDDLFRHCSIAEYASLINDKLHGRHVIRGRIDPLAYINDPITETNMAEEFADHGIFVEKATKALAHGILHAQGALQKENYIYFTPSCRRTLWEIQRYCWDEKENKPIDRDDHMMECFYRAELDNAIYVERTKDSSYAMKDFEITRPEIELDRLDYSLS